MSSDIKVRHKLFKSKQKQNSQLVCYVSGYKGQIRYFLVAIKKLQKLNYDVLAFEYDNSVLANGDPKMLVSVIDQTISVVEDYAKAYDNVVCMGFSLGSMISFNVQKKIENARIGVYAAGGVSASKAIFESTELIAEKKAYISNGFDRKKLKQEWQNLEIDEKVNFPKGKSFITVNGVSDVISEFNIAYAYMQSWRKQGARAKLLKLPFAGHKRTIMWYILNTERLLRTAEKNHKLPIAESESTKQ